MPRKWLSSFSLRIPCPREVKMSLCILLQTERKLHLMRKGRIPEPRTWFSSSATSSSSGGFSSAVSRAVCQSDGTNAFSEKPVTSHFKTSLDEKKNQKRGGTWYSLLKYLATIKEKAPGASTFSSMNNSVISAPNHVLGVKNRETEDIEAAEGNKLILKTSKPSESSSHSVCSIPPHTNKNLDKLVETNNGLSLKGVESSLEFVKENHPVWSEAFSEDETITKVDKLDLAETKPREKKQVLGMETILQRRKVKIISDKVSTENDADLLVSHVSSGIELIEKTTKQLGSSAHLICSMPHHCIEVPVITDNIVKTDHESRSKHAQSSLEFLKVSFHSAASKTSTEDESATKVDQLDLAETEPCKKKQVLGMAAILQRRDNNASDKIPTGSGNKESCSVTDIFKGCKKVTATKNRNTSVNDKLKVGTSDVVSALSSKRAKKKSEPAKELSVESTEAVAFVFKSVLHSHISKPAKDDKNEIHLKPLLDCIKNLPSRKQKIEQVNQTSGFVTGVSEMEIVETLVPLKADTEDNLMDLNFQDVSEGGKKIACKDSNKVAVYKEGKVADFL